MRVVDVGSALEGVRRIDKTPEIIGLDGEKKHLQSINISLIDEVLQL